jgi:lipopolysaccharide/colanic/teichoic acid biosynthesis glycosyltransferase
MDIAIATGALLLLTPVILVIAAAIKITAPGPVFFTDVRSGRDGKPFKMIKFRTMVDGALEMGSGRIIETDDWRITKTGAVLRRWTLDEIPQLFNVIAGQMSIVGPRAATPDQIARLSPEQKRRSRMRPGMAGWAWIHGRNTIPWSERLALDVWYVKHWSLALDFRILAKAVVVMVKREGVYGADGATTDIEVIKTDAEDVIYIPEPEKLRVS